MPNEDPPKGRMDRLPRGLRGLARLATVGLRLDRTVENQNRLGEQLHQQGRRIQNALDGQDERLARLAAETQALRARLDRSREIQGRLGEQLRQQKEQLRRQEGRMKDVLGATNQQNTRLAELEEEARARRADLDQTMREKTMLRERLEAFEAYLPRLRAVQAPVGSGKLGIEATRAEISRVENWYHRIRVAPGVVTPGYNDSDAVLDAMGLPEDLSGVRVLDVGARDGYFSFAAEARGADVLAVDSVPPTLTGFSTAAPLMGSSVEYRTANVYDLVPEEVGAFDAIFFLGVLYHLRDPMLALDRLWDIANPGATIWVESHAIDRGLVDPDTGEMAELASVAPALTEVPMAQFYPKETLGGNFTNWWGPNLACLEAMVEAAGFEVQRSALLGTRALVVARMVEDEETRYHRDYDRGTIPLGTEPDQPEIS